VHPKPAPKLKLPLWQRIAAFFSFVALASALLAPSALLAKEVRTGKLGGLCGTSSVLIGDQGAADAASPQSHCDACGSSGAVLFHGAKQPFADAAEQVTLKADGKREVLAREGEPACIRGPPKH
jgi:hypothetical protein